MTTFQQHVISFCQTFVSVFLTTIGTVIVAIPSASLYDYHSWSGAVIISTVLAVARTAVKVAWEQYMPTGLGGVPR